MNYVNYYRKIPSLRKNNGHFYNNIYEQSKIHSIQFECKHTKRYKSRIRIRQWSKSMTQVEHSLNRLEKRKIQKYKIFKFEETYKIEIYS